MLSFNAKKQLIEFLAEDIGKGDITSALLPKRKISAKIISREDAIIAGVKHASEIFRLKNCNVKIVKKDDSKIKPNQTIMTITGDTGNILTCERTALNFKDWDLVAPPNCKSDSDPVVSLSVLRCSTDFNGQLDPFGLRFRCFKCF